MGPSLFAQALLNITLSIRGNGLPSKIATHSLRLLRSALVRIWDPLVSYELDGRTLVLPLSHDLPVIRSRHPDYSENLGRIATAIAKARPDGTAIDIGANVGDSVAIMRRICSLPILCIEGDARFFRILQENLPVLGPDVEICETLLGSDTATISHALRTERGTGRLVSTSDQTVRTMSVEDLLRRFPRFATPSLVKIDTDGFDIPILRGALPALARMSRKPVLFFEYDPHFLKQNAEDGLATLRALNASGYSAGLVYDNLGDLMLSADLSDSALWSELHAYFSTREARRYMDLCLFSSADRELFESIRTSELEYFASQRA